MRFGESLQYVTGAWARQAFLRAHYETNNSGVAPYRDHRFR